MHAFIEISLILAIALAVAWVMQLLRQPLILGHIITGIVVGPFALDILRSVDALALFSHIGIAALLFIVGLGLNPSVVREVGRVSVYAGLGQVLFTAVAGFFLAWFFGFDPVSALYIGIALTFASTIIVFKILSDKQDSLKLYGKITTGILLVQDMIATAILVLLSAFGREMTFGAPFALLLIKGLLAIALLMMVSRYILPLLARTFARSQEFLFLFAVTWGLGIASLLQWLGFTIEVGALAAGISLARSPYLYAMRSKMKDLRDFFIVWFFVLVGAQIMWTNASQLWVPTVVLSLFVLIGNPLILMIIMGALGYNRRISFLTGLTMSQISEFSLVLMTLGYGLGHIGNDAVTIVTLVGLITIVISSFMMLHAEKMLKVLYPLLGIFERRRPQSDRGKRESFEMFLFGCHRLGLDFLPYIQKSGLSYLVVDFDPHMIDRLQRQGVSCRYGDASDHAFLEDFDFRHTKLAVITIPEEQITMSLIGRIRKANRQAIIIATAHRVSEARRYYDQGATYVIMPHYLGGNYASLLIGKYGLDADRFKSERAQHLQHLKERPESEPNLYGDT